jgi:hypothetical protein
VISTFGGRINIGDKGKAKRKSHNPALSCYPVLKKLGAGELLKCDDPKTVVAVLGSFIFDLPFVRAIIISTVVKSNAYQS